MGRQDSMWSKTGSGDCAGAETRGARMQYAAVCWRLAENEIELLLITSRDTGRWVIPKGWPIAGKSPEATAAQEAWEEAGVKGQVSPVCLGRFGYLKELSGDSSVPCAVAVYGLPVADLAEDFPERKERTRRWFSREEAAANVAEPDLAQLLRNFVPPRSGRAGPVGDAEDGFE